jgi:hypothetical protein
MEFFDIIYRIASTLNKRANQKNNNIYNIKLSRLEIIESKISE